MTQVLKMVGDRVLIDPIQREKVTPGGIALPDNLAEDKYDKGRVLDVGRGQLVDDGYRLSLPIKAGMVVLYDRKRGMEVQHEGKAAVLLDVGSVLAAVVEH